MSNASAKTFDAVQSVRTIRDAVSTRIATVTVDDENRWLRSETLEDPALRRLMERAATAASRDAKGVGKSDGTLPAKPDETSPKLTNPTKFTEGGQRRKRLKQKPLGARAHQLEGLAIARS